MDGGGKRACPSIKKRYDLIIQPKRGFFKPETGKRHDLMPKGQKMEEREVLKPQKGLSSTPFLFRVFSRFFPLYVCILGKTCYFIVFHVFFCRGLVAQSVEHRPFKAGVQGSSPCQLTFFVPSFLRFSSLNAKRRNPVLFPKQKKEKGSHTKCKPLKIKMVVGGGFGPPKAWPVDLQSTAFDRSATPPGNSTWSG